MSYLVEALMASGKSKISQGLNSGTLQRWGGVIRVAAGHPGAGRIVAHLHDIAPVRSPLGVLETASSVVANVQLHRISNALGQVLQMTNVAAAASVLNLGVSAVGFAIMAAKLTRLQDDMNRALGLMQENHRDMLSHLGEIEERLVELRYIGIESQSRLLEALQSIRDVRQDLLDGYIARMQAELMHLEHSASLADHHFESAWKTFTEARLWLKNGIEGQHLAADRPEQWFDLLTRYRAWCFAVAGEVQIARRAGDLQPAAQIAGCAAIQSRQWIDRWRGWLIPDHKFGGVFRFIMPARFDKIPDETKHRLIRMQHGNDLPACDLRALIAAREIAEQAPALPEGWFERQYALSRVFDFAEEATERIESMAAETAYCAERRIGYERWEQLPAPSENEGIGLIKIAEAE